MCTHSLESQLYLGLHQKYCGQQVKRRESATLLCTCETSHGVLYFWIKKDHYVTHSEFLCEVEQKLSPYNLLHIAYNFLSKYNTFENHQNLILRLHMTEEMPLHDLLYFTSDLSTLLLNMCSTE